MSIYLSIYPRTGRLTPAGTSSWLWPAQQPCLVPESHKSFLSQGLKALTPGSFGEISICMLATVEEHTPHGPATQGPGGTETGPELAISFFLTLLNLFGYLNKQKL